MVINNKACLIADKLGRDIDDLLEEAVCDSVCPGICTYCNEVREDCEPDLSDGYCEECKTHTVKSILVLTGLI